MFHHTGLICFEAFYLHVVSSFSCIPVICPKLVLFLTPLQFVHLFCNLSQVYPAVLLLYFISAAVILPASLALTIQVSLPYNNIGRARGPEAKGSNPTAGLILLWARNPFRGNINHWQVSRKEAGQI